MCVWNHFIFDKFFKNKNVWVVADFSMANFFFVFWRFKLSFGERIKRE